MQETDEDECALAKTGQRPGCVRATVDVSTIALMSAIKTRDGYVRLSSHVMCAQASARTQKHGIDA